MGRRGSVLELTCFTNTDGEYFPAETETLSSVGDGDMHCAGNLFFILPVACRGGKQKQNVLNLQLLLKRHPQQKCAVERVPTAGRIGLPVDETYFPSLALAGPRGHTPNKSH
jgi:hypothetical protein